MSESSALPNSCPQCGAVLPSEATAGLCPRCILAQAMQPGAEEPTGLDVTVRVAAPVSSGTARPEVDLPLPEELTNLLPHGNYSVEGFLGQGGMGAVYRGTQVRLRRPVAIKIMRRDMGKDHDFEQRFEREAQAMAKLNHPNIVSVIDYGEAGPDYLYIVMELVDGADLMDVIRGGQMTQEMALSLLPQICDALQFAHDHGIVHRDIKPSNIMLTRSGHIKMADFGLAKRFDVESSFRTQTGTGMGTPDYAAPEQFDPTCAIDHRADIYALGVMIYQMITGQLPRGVWKPPSQRASVAPQWDAIVSRAMQSDPSDRYQQASEVKTDVSSIPLATRSTDTPARSAPKGSETIRPAPYDKPKSKTPLIVAVVALAFIITSAFLTFKNPAQTSAPTTSLSHATSASSLPVSKPLPASAPQNLNASKNATATKDKPFINTLGMKFVPVPIGGGPTKGMPVLFGVWDTRVADYAAYAAAKQVDDTWTKQERNGVPVSRVPDHPVAGVSWEDAQGFCQWLTEKESAEGKLPKGFKYRLPTDEEWSWAVGLPQEFGATPAAKSAENGVDFPWGKNWPPNKKIGNYGDESLHTKSPKNVEDKTEDQLWIEGYDDGFAMTSPVGSFLPNTHGLYDMGGNVWQWCEDSYDAADKRRVLRGASWYSGDRKRLLSSFRIRDVPGFRKDHYGFRCVLAPATSAPDVAAAQLSPSSEPWQDVLHDSAKLAVYSGARRVDEGLSFSGKKGMVAIQPTSAQRRDGALRIRATFSDMILHLVARGNDTAAYELFAFANRIQLSAYDGAAKRAKILGDYPLGEPLQPGQDYELELRVVGQTLTARFNGKLLGTATDGTYTQGNFKVNALAEGSGATTALVKSLEFLDLDTAQSGTGVLPVKTANTTGGTPVPPSAATKDKPFVNTLGMKFVPVPITGGPTDKQRLLFSIWETRLQDYDVFVKDAKHYHAPTFFPQEPAHPVVSVSWNDAHAFCAWLTARDQAEGKIGANERYRLPSDHEWSCAAGIGGREDPTRAPWEKNDKIPGEYLPETGDEPAADNASFSTFPVGSRAANRFGLFDLGGNVVEWCEDLVQEGKLTRVLRGGGRNKRLASHRNDATPEVRAGMYGFRCVLAPAASVPVADTAAHLSPSTEPWSDALADPTALKLSGRAKLTSEGLEFGDGGESRATFPRLKGNDYAVRVIAEATYGKPINYLYLRHTTSGYYIRFRASDGLTIGRYAPTNQFNDLKTFAVPRTLKAGESYELEARIVGNKITAKFDGVTLGSVEDDTLHDGGPSITVGNLFRAVQYLDLSSPTKSATPATAAFSSGSIADILTSPDYEWSAPENLGPGVNSEKSEDSFVLSADGLEIVFNSNRDGQDKPYASRRASVNDAFGPATPLREFDVIQKPKITSFSADGLTLFFHSGSGPNGQGGTDLYQAHRRDRAAPWGAISNLRSPVNTNHFDEAASLSPDGLALLFESSRPSGQGGQDLWISRRKTVDSPFETPANLGAGICTSDEEHYPRWAGDSKSFFFLRSSSADKGRRENFLATPDTGGGMKALPLRFPMKNNTQYFSCSSDGRTVYFAALNLPGGQSTLWDIWQIRRVPKAKTASAVSTDGWISLMDKIDPVVDAVKGTWSRSSGDLVTDGNGNSMNVLQVPYEPPEEYDFRMAFTCQARQPDASQILSAKGHNFQWLPSGYSGQFSGFDKVRPYEIDKSPAGVKLTEPLHLHQRYESLVEVRRDRVTGYVDGKKVVDWKTDYSDMSIASPVRLRDANRLGLSIYQNKTTFHDISVREVTGKGKIIAPASYATPATSTKDAPFINTLGMQFVPVPETHVSFCIHETRKQDYAAYALANSGVGDQWKNVSKDGVPVSDGDGHPVCSVSWSEANAFCAWLSKKEGLTYRLPTDREWSFAVGLGSAENAAADLTPAMLSGKVAGKYPWGPDWPPPTGAGNFNDLTFKEKFPTLPFIDGFTDGYATTAPVMRFKPNELGIYDLAGNVWEWCADPWDATSSEHVIRGGAWNSSGRGDLNSSSRSHNDASWRVFTGFRCVLDVSIP